ncbi:hypothetical protein Y88_0652 [Novosphingobium nitrogenifigens DSM 19370]|uniref:Uncharacterized protein n=1 Tax=Novosphingobium nitrogenifigens DSM 19370 TaxID=983920 RepID=F1Z9Z8_9SPHN|nr:hypothetical protein Y88_0652 [Novosphingobium nitrogenifigens DSM 19370]
MSETTPHCPKSPCSTRDTPGKAMAAMRCPLVWSVARVARFWPLCNAFEVTAAH